MALLVVLMLASCGRPAGDAELAQFRAEALQAFGSFQKQLQGALLAAIQKGGAPSAIETCRLVSPELEQRFSRGGVTVRRVSTRPRNPAHEPDAFEREVLEQWSRDLQQGRSIAAVARRTPAGLRVLKPIRIAGGLCLQCHGSPAQISPEVRAALAKNYPRDRAVGYELGQLRGAFSATHAARP